RLEFAQERLLQLLERRQSIEHLGDFGSRFGARLVAPRQLVKRAHQVKLRLATAWIIVSELAIRDIGLRQRGLGLRQPEKPRQLAQIVAGIGKPFLVFDEADREIPQVTEDLGHIDVPAQFAQIGGQPVPLLQRAGSLRWVPDAQSDLPADAKLLRRLMPSRLQTYRA